MLSKIPPPVFFMGSGFCQYVGAALAVGVFLQIGPLSVAWLRILLSGVILLAWRRPRNLSWSDIAWSVVFGLVLGGMNMVFYEAIARIPLGAAVSVEYLGPVLVAVIGSRGWRSRVAIFLALAGVVSIGGWGVDINDPEQRLGIVLALIAGGCWAAYILLGRSIATKRSGLDSLAIGMFAAGVLLAPIGGGGSALAWTDGLLFLTVLGVAVLSSVIPYGVEQLILARIPAANFALLTALLPVTSLIVGLIVLRQIPNWAELLGLTLVSVAVALSSYQPKH
ncbi:MAG: EamA family transporter [Actinomycetaceae bacterium]|nr:EamA family transporter [Actinomycetaceae bacterium]